MLRLYSKYLRSLARRNRSSAADATVWDAGKPFQEIPGPQPIPVIGNAWRHVPVIGSFHGMDSVSLQQALFSKYGPIVKYGDSPGLRTMVYLFDPNDIEKVYRNDGAHPIRDNTPSVGHYRRVTRKELYKGMLGVAFSQGEEWYKIRSAVNPTLMQPKSIRLYTQPVNDVADDFIKRIKLIRDNKNEMPATFYEDIKSWTLESLASSVLNTRLGCLDPNLKPGSDSGKLISLVGTMFDLIYRLNVTFSLWAYLSTPTWRKFVQTMDELTEIILNRYINEALHRIKSNPGIIYEECSILEKILIKNPNPRLAVTVIMDLFLAGVDTTANATSAILYHLATNPDKQRILREEVMKVVPNANTEPIKSGQLDELRYLRACIKESLRMFPVSIGNMRTTSKDLVVGGYQLPKGTIVFLGHTVLSRMEKYFPESDRYIPERWLKDSDGGKMDAKKSHPFISLPFGFGARMCIARRFSELEMEVLITKVIYNFELSYAYGKLKEISKFIMSPGSPLKFTMIDVK